MFTPFTYPLLQTKKRSRQIIMEGHEIHHEVSYDDDDDDEKIMMMEEQRIMVGGDTGDNNSKLTLLSQWSKEETREFLSIRGGLDKTFMETKRNKILWDVISFKMKDKGFLRNAQQCKCKWKNLVTRYKGCETIEIEAMRQQQFPFYNEMHAIFTSRVWTDQAYIDSRRNNNNSTTIGRTKQPLSSSHDDVQDNEGTSLQVEGISTKRVSKKAKIIVKDTSGCSIISNGVKEVVVKMMRQQEEMEAEWRVAEAAREEGRRRMEKEWRERMAAVAEARVAMEREWRDMEEQRWIREEARAEKRDALIVALLNKLTSEEKNEA